MRQFPTKAHFARSSGSFSVFSMNADSQTVALNQISAFYTRQSDTRRVGFSFLYRFGKEANARKRNTVGSAEDEKMRTN